jgi:chemotaxis response regulator CheB
MPGEAVKRGAAGEVLALERIADRVIALARRG